ncbi:hypothetical protein B2D07_04310 [Desulfococcus multivorans]|nr:conserved uncharacterized protein [Desulfococcus multivorans]AQV00071.1 hypothetical protein B2D07_04310 [Desulfococcus multivorans]
MGTCIHHPERETAHLCMKHPVYPCEDCLTRREPERYCKFRQSCPIRAISKEGRRRKRRAPEAGTGYPPP